MSKTLRGGRLGSKRADVAEFTSSIKDDAKLADAVIDINKAHVVMLAEQKIVKQQDAAKLLKALTGKLKLKMDAKSEDVHMAVEEAILAITGSDVGGNMHIGKSRNDQVATAIRMELRKKLLALMDEILKLEANLTETANRHIETIILGYTHLQPAQPVTFAHYLLARFDQLNRDLQRLKNTYVNVNLCPLGSGALSTTSLPINRERVAGLLGFDGLAENSIDAVGSRDFILETLADLSIAAVNLSQFAEDLLIWGTADYGVLELPDEFTTTSSMMPQKKNAEVLEVIRARAGNVLGDFVAAVSMMKAMPSTYNLDFQEITPKLWEAIATVYRCLTILVELVPNIKVNANVATKADKSYVAATELANLLVRKYGVPFRSAHKIVGAAVKKLIEAKQTFKDITPELLEKTANDTVGITLNVKADDIADSTGIKKLVASHKVVGGPAPATVRKALTIRKKSMVESKSYMSMLHQKLDVAQKSLEDAAKTISEGQIPNNGRFKNSARSVE